MQYLFLHVQELFLHIMQFNTAMLNNAIFIPTHAGTVPKYYAIQYCNVEQCNIYSYMYKNFSYILCNTIPQYRTMHSYTCKNCPYIKYCNVDQCNIYSYRCKNCSHILCNTISHPAYCAIQFLHLQKLIL